MKAKGIITHLDYKENKITIQLNKDFKVDDWVVKNKVEISESK